MWKRILDNFSCLGIKPPDHIQVVRGIPDAVVRADSDRIWKRIHSSRDVILLKGFRLGIEAADLSLLEFAEPDSSIRVDRDSTFVRVEGWRHPLRHFQGLR